MKYNRFSDVQTCHFLGQGHSRASHVPVWSATVSTNAGDEGGDA